MSLAPFSASILFALGLVLVGLEMFVGSFYILWFGLGFFIVGIVEMIYPFSGALYQVSTAFVIALVLLFLLKNKVSNFLKKSEKEIKDDFLNEEGEGVIKEGMLFYKGTMWEYEPSSLRLKNGDKVRVLSAKGNKAKIEKLED